MNFTFGRFDVSLNLRSRRRWNTVYYRRDSTELRLVWGRVSLHIEDWQAEVHPTCKQCGSADIAERSYGDEGWTVCDSCQSVEGGYVYVNKREYENCG